MTTKTQNGNARLVLGVIIAAVATLIAVLVWSNPFSSNTNALTWEESISQSDTPSLPQSEVPQSEPEPEPQPVTFTMVFGGDMLIHMPVANDAWDGESYDLAKLMKPTKAYIQGADLAICNMETPVREEGETPTGYPIFGAPNSLIFSMAETGWDGCTTSSNHAMDYGLAGIRTTLDTLDEAGMGHVGTARSQEEADSPQFYELEKDGETVTVANISAADNLNGFSLPDDAPWAVNLIDIERMIDQATQAREDGADIVVASLHCCTAEYTQVPEEKQEEVAEALAESGQVDVMVSHHAHVPKPIDLLDGGPNGQGMWVAWGVGNFISNQGIHEGLVEQSSTGILAYFEFTIEEGKPTVFDGASWRAVTVNMSNHKVYPLTEDGPEDVSTPEAELRRRHDQVVELMEGYPVTERQGPPEGEAAKVTVVSRRG